MSDEPKLSPGPWRWGEGLQDYTLLDARGYRIIELSAASSLPEPDARAIAAVPRMVELLKYAYGQHETCFGHLSECTCYYCTEARTLLRELGELPKEGT